uniref:Reverse transcriptase domain-containing protein n=1 Tax=Tanacetum cinerariifolium TaxID=118510 RepID=A0A6L2MGL9_TANCI|nr:reverse transcriptase domain-containing protein [Tanacetum cinerariifolium]
MTSMCKMVGQLIQKKQEEKQIQEDQAANARYWKIPAYYDDGDDYNFAITPNETVDSLIMVDEHLDTVPATESDEFIKSSVENLVPNPKEIFSNPLFEEEINSMGIGQHHFNVESDLIGSLLNHDSSIIPSSSKIDSLLDEFAGELPLLKSIASGIDETDYLPENEIRLSQRLLYDNSSPRLPEEFVSENSNADAESFSPFPIRIEDNNSFMDEIDLTFTPDDPMPSSIEEDNDDSRDIQIREELLDNYSLPLPDNKNLFPPLDNLDLTIRKRSHVDPTLLNDFEMAAEGNGDPPVPDLWTMEELCQPSLNGQGGPITPIDIQSTSFRLKNDMIQQVQNSC